MDNFDELEKYTIIPDTLERYTIVLYHKTITGEKITNIEEPVVCHIYLSPFLKKTHKYSKEYLLRELAEKLHKILENEDENYEENISFILPKR